MIELVISGGDSFTFGAELDTDTPHLPSSNSWANLVAMQLGAQHINTAYSGRGNSFITRRVMHQVTLALLRGIPSEKIFVQVMWTFANRHEFALANEHIHWDSPWIGITTYTAEDESKSDWFMKVSPDSKHYEIIKKHLHETYLRNLKIGVVDFAKHFITAVQAKGLHDSYASASAVLQLQDFLTLRKIKHMFTYVDQSALDGIATDSSHDAGSEYLNTVRSEIDFDSWYHFPAAVGFLGWSRDNDYEFATSHPLEPAHQDAAQLIVEHVRRNVLNA